MRRRARAEGEPFHARPVAVREQCHGCTGTAVREHGLQKKVRDGGSADARGDHTACARAEYETRQRCFSAMSTRIKVAVPPEQHAPLQLLVATAPSPHVDVQLGYAPR